MASQSLSPAGGKKSNIVFPAACTSEKHTAARSVDLSAYSRQEARHRAETPHPKGTKSLLDKKSGAGKLPAPDFFIP